MRRPLAIAVGALAVLAGPSSALAFQQTPEAPPAEATPAAPQAKTPAMQLATPGAPGGQQPDKKGVPVFGFGIFPKLDFGLELLYGQAQPEQLQLQQGETLEEDAEMSVVGKVKRRF